MESLSTSLLLGYWVGDRFQQGQGQFSLCQASCPLSAWKSDSPSLPPVLSQSTPIIINIINKKRGKLLNVKYAKFLSDLTGQFINVMA